MRFRTVFFLALVGGCVSCAGPRARSSSGPDAVKDAVAELRRVHPERLSDEQKKEKGAALDRAWAVLRAEPGAAVAALKAEWGAIAAAGERDDYFAIEAAHLLFVMEGLREITTIEAMYRTVDYAVNFQLAFETLARLSATRDPRVIPILRNALAIGARTGEVFFAQHFLRVTWPRTVDFIFAPYGPELCTLAADEATRSRPPASVRSAVFLLSVNRCVEGVPIVRRLAAADEVELAADALRALGVLGGPADRPFIEKFAEDARADIRYASAFALYEAGDPASTPVLRRLLKDPDAKVRSEAIVGLFHLIDGDSVQPLLTHSRDSKVVDERQAIARFVQELSREVDVSDELLMKGDTAAWEKAIVAYWRKRDAFFDLKPDDRVLTRREFLDALGRWEAAHTIDEKGWEWVEHRHVLAVATPDDIPALLSLRGRVLERHSDEALEEVRVIDRLTQVLHRRRVGAKKPNE